MASGASEAERGAAYQQAQVWLHACAEAWYANIDPSTLNFAALPHQASGQVDLAGPKYSSLRDAVGAASSVVVGRVTSVAIADHRTVFNVTVEQTIKGPSLASIAMSDESQLVPATLPPNGAAIRDQPGESFPIPGSRIVLLGDASSGNVVSAQQFTGLYYVSGGTVNALPDNPFAASVSGTTETMFISQLVADSSA